MGQKFEEEDISQSDQRYYNSPNGQKKNQDI